MEREATPIQQIKVQAISQSGGGWDSQRRCWRLRIVVGPKPRRQELHDDTDGGTDVRATVRGDASGALLRQSLECHRRKQVCHHQQWTRQRPCLWTASNAHHDWEERDGASDVEVGHIEEEAISDASPHSQHCSRNDELGCSEHQNMFERTAFVMRSVQPFWLKPFWFSSQAFCADVCALIFFFFKKCILFYSDDLIYNG